MATGVATVHYSNEKNLTLTESAQIKALHRASVNSIKEHFSASQIQEWTGNTKEDFYKSILNFERFYRFFNSDLKLVGFAGISEKGFLKMLYIHPNFQRNGFGTTCLRVLESDPENLSTDGFLRLNANQASIYFYQKSGYYLVKEHSIQVGKAVLQVALMEKKVEKS